MKVNMRLPDRFIRFALSIVGGYLYYSLTLTGKWGAMMLLAAAVLITTSLIGYCPVYSILGIRTGETQKD